MNVTGKMGLYSMGVGAFPHCSLLLFQRAAVAIELEDVYATVIGQIGQGSSDHQPQRPQREGDNEGCPTKAHRCSLETRIGIADGIASAQLQTCWFSF